MFEIRAAARAVHAVPTYVLACVLASMAACDGQIDAAPAQHLAPASTPALDTNAVPTDMTADAASVERKRDLPSGLWRRARVRSTDPGLSPEDRELVEQLESLGYASGSLPPSAERLITVHDREKSSDGLNFLTSGHEAGALLIDMEGRVLHRWHASKDASTSDPDRVIPPFWRRAYLFENGDVLAVFGGQGLEKLDRNSKVIWTSKATAHHDLEVMPNGDIYLLTREVNQIDGIFGDRPFMEDFITVLDANGKEKRKLSVVRALVESEFSDLFDPETSAWGDLLHTNSIQVLDGKIADRAPAFSAGRVLISMAVPNLIAVVDLDLGKVVWAHKDDFVKQHDPQVLADGSLLLFDNLGRKPASRILELDPASLKRKWIYAGTPEDPFFSATCGTAQRLANGNTLITESDNGRAFEVTSNGAIVWEFNNPYRAGNDDEFVAALFEVLRLPADFPIDWAKAASAAADLQ